MGMTLVAAAAAAAAVVVSAAAVMVVLVVVVLLCKTHFSSAEYVVHTNALLHTERPRASCKK